LPDPVYPPDQATAETLENTSYLAPPVQPLPGCKQDPIPEKPTPAQHRNTQQNSPCDPHRNPLPAIYHPYTALSTRTVKVYGIPQDHLFDPTRSTRGRSSTTSRVRSSPPTAIWWIRQPSPGRWLIRPAPSGSWVLVRTIPLTLTPTQRPPPGRLHSRSRSAARPAVRPSAAHRVLPRRHQRSPGACRIDQ
jgi:hypothetical protein